MLRSSSTPLLGSLLPSFSETPNNNNHHHSELHGHTHKHTPNSIHSILSCTNGGSQDFRKSLFPSPSLAETKSTGRSCSNTFRRVQSEGNLEGLVDGSNNVESGRRRRSSCALVAIPSFSSYSCRDEDSDNEDEIELEVRMEDTCNLVRVENLTLEQVRNDLNGYGSLSFEGEGKMYLATGLGVSSIDFADGGDNSGHCGGGGSYRLVGFNRDGGDSRALSMEQHYKKILEENPGNALFLRNYAQFLYQIKGDLGAAEEYYSRAILADPKDGEILSQYAKIIWELHHDKERAAHYYERAVQASSDNSHIQASYASFLWDTENEEEDENGADSARVGQPLIHHGLMASATA